MSSATTQPTTAASAASGISADARADGRAGAHADSYGARRLIRFMPLVVLLGILALLVVGNPRIAGPSNLSAIAVAAVPSALIAIGLAIIIAAAGDDVINGGIDLSLPNQAVIAAAIIALLLARGFAFPVALLAGVAVALAVGALNSFLIVTLGMIPILATLATSVFVGGATRAVTTNRRIEVTDPFIIALRDDAWLGVPVVIWFAVAVVVLASLFFHHTRYGLRIQAVGGNREFASSSGVKPGLYTLLAFLIASLLAGLAATTLLARASGWSSGSEDQLLLDMLLAAYLAPVFSARFIYTPLGAAIGALLTAALSNALVLGGIDNSLIDGAKGLLILMVIGASALARKD
ncbi:ABC transporter permease [Bifidobacterium jacchi]|uniref:ABC transporter permease n=1 Tax=Bifidobacterium jacchi TaxID=2490545 RepID=A0A5N5RFB0_9BIFI|nr:ABC transporter permease [Bifidobacterium jacchi]KAB5605421.1 ABC transporter permease [Bifidobacterium jacchi]